ncbi:MAG: double zinc ribbon domain-containing protein [Methylovirgula sp.]
MTYDDPARADVPPVDWALVWRVVLRHGRNIASAAFDIVFPPSCLACRKAVGGAWCAMPGVLAGRVGFIDRPYCERLGTPFAYDLGVPGLQSPEAMANPPVYQRARAVARFEDGPVRVLIHRLKYGDRMELAKPLGLWMARAGAELLAEADLLIPVPLHRRRLIWRQSGERFGRGDRQGRAARGLSRSRLRESNAPCRRLA